MLEAENGNIIKYVKTNVSFWDHKSVRNSGFISALMRTGVNTCSILGLCWYWVSACLMRYLRSPGIHFIIVQISTKSQRAEITGFRMSYLIQERLPPNP